MQEPLDRQAISLRWYYSVETLTSRTLLVGCRHTSTQLMD